MSKYGIRIAKKSIDDNKDLIFRSDLNTLKLDIDPKKGLIDFIKYKFPNNPAAPGIAGKATYPVHTFRHNLGYIPQHSMRCYDYNFNGSYITPGSYEEGVSTLISGATLSQGFEYYLTDKILQINYVVEDIIGGGALLGDVTGATFGFKYMIFANPMKP